MNPHYTVRRSGRHTLVKFRDSPPVAPRDVGRIGGELLELSEEQPAGRLVLDCSNVAHLSSQAMSMMLDLHQKISARPAGGGRLVLCGLSQRVRQTMRITRLDTVLTIVPSYREAVAGPEKVGTGN